MNKLDVAKSKLMLEHPYLGAIATNLKIEFNNNIDSVNKKGDILEINLEYINRLNSDEICSILANGALYQALFHENRAKGKIKSLWKIASDFAINDILVQNGFKLHPLAKYKATFNNLYAEEIYKILLDSIDLNSLPKDEDTNLIQKQDYINFLEEITNKFKNSNELPKGLDRILNIAKKSKISWQQLLYRYLNDQLKIDYTLFPPNKKFIYQGIYLPSINGDELKIAIAIDTSASINQELLDNFFSEVIAILQSFKNYEILLIECDYKLRNISRLKPLERFKPKTKGGGTTDFRPVFDYLQKLNEDFKLLIYFTDLEGSLPTYTPQIETLWILTKDKKTPFGRKIILN
jgi:predicted metal-dependent peptidase